MRKMGTLIVSDCMSERRMCAGAVGDQEGTGILDTGLQMVISCPTWVLRTKLRASVISSIFENFIL